VFISSGQAIHDVPLALKASLHYSDYRSKLVHFEAHKNILYVKKGPSSERFTP